MISGSLSDLGQGSADLVPDLEIDGGSIDDVFSTFADLPSRFIFFVAETFAGLGS